MLLPNRRNNLFDDMFKEPFFTRSAWLDDAQMMKTDVQEKDGKYVIDMELPGFAKEEIKAEIKDGYLTISANHNEAKDEKDKDGNYIRRERYVGTCKRSFYVGGDVKEEDIKAGFKDGVLNISFPKEAEKIAENPKVIAIE